MFPLPARGASSDCDANWSISVPDVDKANEHRRGFVISHVLHSLCSLNAQIDLRTPPWSQITYLHMSHQAFANNASFKSSIKAFMDSQQKLCFPSSDRNQSESRLVTRDEMNFAYERRSIVKGIYILLCSHLLGAAFTDAQRQFPLCWAFVSRGKWKLFSNFINSASDGNSPGRLLHQNYSANVVVIVAVEDSRGCGECLKFSFRKLSVIDRRVSALKSMNTLVQPKAFIL